MLARRMCAGLAQPLFHKQCVPLRPVLYQIPQFTSINLTLRCLRAVGARSSCAKATSLRPRGSVWKPLLCTIGICSTSYVLAAIWDYENCFAEWQSRLRQRVKRNVWSLCPPSLGGSNTEAVSGTSEWNEWMCDLQRRWNVLTEGQKVYLVILGLNALVFAAWQVPRFCSVMQRWFTGNICSGVLCWPLLLAAFSHSNVVHLGLNMYALHAAIDSAVYKMGKEQFVFFYVSAAAVASLFSYYWLLYNCAQACSLGASGAVFAVYSYLCTEMPDLRLQIIFLPGFDFRGDTGVTAIALLSLAGVIFKWQKIDHMCHLAGIVFGAAFSAWGTRLVWNQRGIVKQRWENLRQSLTENK